MSAARRSSSADRSSRPLRSWRVRWRPAWSAARSNRGTASRRRSRASDRSTSRADNDRRAIRPAVITFPPRDVGSNGGSHEHHRSDPGRAHGRVRRDVDRGRHRGTRHEAADRPRRCARRERGHARSDLRADQLPKHRDRVPRRDARPVVRRRHHRPPRCLPRSGGCAARGPGRVRRRADRGPRDRGG